MNYPKLVVADKEKQVIYAPIELDPRKLGNVSGVCSSLTFNGKQVRMERRASGNLREVSLYLSSYEYDYVLGKDDADEVCLVVMKKEKD